MTTLHENGEEPIQYIPESSPYDRMLPIEMEEASALERVTSLPLVANTWDYVSTYYASAKKTYPSVTPYLEMAEKITTSAASVALTTTKPVVDKIAPTVNSYANRGLDKLEDALPIIHDQPDEIYDSAKAAVASAVNGRIDSALTVTERYVDYFLPPTQKEQIQMEEDEDSDEDDSDDDDSDTSSVQDEPSSPKERLRIISDKVKRRAYNRAMDRIHGVQRRSTETLSKLKFTVDLIQYAKENMDATRDSIASTVSSANETIRSGVSASQENVANVWKEIRNRSSDAAAELHILDRARGLTERVQKSCGTLLTVVTNLPQYEFLVTKITKAKESADELAHGLSGKTSLSELSASVVATARSNLDHCKNLLEALIEVATEHAPISWLAPEFDSDPLEGLFMQDLEADLHMHQNNEAANFEPRANQTGRHVRFSRG